MEIAVPRVLVEDYYKILVAFEQIREANEILKVLKRKTKSVTSPT